MAVSNACTASPTSAAISWGCRSYVRRPASIRPQSSSRSIRSLSRAVSRSSTSRHVRVSSGSRAPPAFSISANIRIEVSGVRSSWLTLETKSSCSFDSLASRRSSTSASTVPVTRQPTRVTTRIPKTRLRRACQNTSMRMPTASSAAVGTTTRQISSTTMRRKPRPVPPVATVVPRVTP